MRRIRELEEELSEAEIDYTLLKDYCETLQAELVEKDAAIKKLEEELTYCRKEWKEQMLQDQGLKE
jgi:SMC interacting uncharacterized protein involved in chromosome segregation